MAKFVRKEKVLHLRIFTLEIKICKFKISCCDFIGVYMINRHLYRRNYMVILKQRSEENKL